LDIVEPVVCSIVFVIPNIVCVPPLQGP
jgi:hypothetical protein